jgi:hypothetical protein
MDTQTILDLISKHQWIGLAALIIGFLVRLMKDDTRFPPFAIPARWRPWAALGLGVVSGVLQAVSTGTAWKDALLGGLVSAFAAIAGHDAIVNGVLGGREVPMPAALTRKSSPPPALDPGKAETPTLKDVPRPKA